MRNRLQALQSALLLIVLMFVAPVCLAQEYEYADFKEDNVFYKICEDSTTVEVCSQNSFGVIYFDSYSGDIVIPSTVTHEGKTYDVIGISGGAFYMCDGLTSVSIANSVTYIEGYGIMNSWQGSYYVGTFGNCTNLRSIIFPDQITAIGSWTCYGCSSLSEIDLPESLTSIGGNAFSGCSSLTELSIPDNVTSIAGSAFSDCSSLKSVYFGKSMTSFFGSSFENCSGIESIRVSSENVTLDSRDDCNAVIETSTNCLVFGCKNTIIPLSVSEIGYGAFKGCRGLMSIVIPDAVTTIGSEAFYGCSGLSSVTIPNSVISIGSSAFSYCSGLTSVSIGSSVNTIGNYAFSSCSSLDSVTCWALTPPSINNYSFSGTPSSMTVYVPQQSLETYRSNISWKRFNLQSIQELGLKGDANGDGEVSIADINTIIDAILNDEMEDRYDVNGDGELNIADINALIDIILTS